MTSTQEENAKLQGDFNSTENESNVLDSRPVRCFPTVKRSFRQKQSNWRWRWKNFTRHLQPIMEQGESSKDDTSKMDGNATNSSTDEPDESELDSSEGDHMKVKNEQAVNSNENGDMFNEEAVKLTTSKDDYSPCITLIEKFQEAVIDNAVRVIQAAFKRFRERQRFLKLRKAATIIQRVVRKWLGNKRSCKALECHLTIKGSGQPADMVQSALSSCLNSQGHNIDETVGNDESTAIIGSQIKLEDKNHDNLEGFDCCEDWIENKDSISVETSDGTSQFEDTNSLECLDISSLCGSCDNICDAGLSIDPCEDSHRAVDPDALSLADSGIDTCSDIGVEAALTDECKFLSSENPSPNALNMEENSATLL